MHFDDAYREHVTLRDGTAIEIRLIQPSDAENLQRGLARLSPDSRYLRFFTAKPRLTDAEVRYLTNVDGVDHFAIVAGIIHDDGTEEGLGVARFVRLPDRADAAEAAIAVVDDMQGKGLGSLLLRKLSAAAYERGVRFFVSECLTENTGVLDLLRGLQPDLVVEPVGEGVVRVSVAIAEHDPGRPETWAGRANAIARLLAHAAEGVVSFVHSLRRT